MANRLRQRIRSFAGGRGLLGFKPPSFDDILQWLDGTQTALGFYTGVEENGTETTITKNQSIAADWSVWLEAIWIPQNIGEYEGIHTWDNGIALEWDASGSRCIVIYGNGIPYTTTLITLEYNEITLLKIELRTGEFRLTVNDMSEVLTGITFNSLESAFSVFTGRGYILSLSDGEQTYYPDKTYPEVTTVGPAGTYRKYDLLPNKSASGIYGLYDNETGLINIDPNGTLETALGLTAGTLNDWLTRAELDTLYFGSLGRKQLWTAKNDPLKYVDVIYNLSVTLGEADKNKLDVYHRRSSILQETDGTWIDLGGGIFTQIDTTGAGNDVLYDTNTGLFNHNPLDNTELTARGFTGWQTCLEIEALQDGQISFTSISGCE